jgi:putative ABC transport system ATP-binding protein
MKLYELQNIAHRYTTNGRQVSAVCDVDLDIQQGDFVAIAGPSGSGKTTLLNILGFLEAPSQGTLRFNSADVSQMSERERATLRRERIGFIFQTFNLIPVLTAYENVEYFLLTGRLSRLQVRQRVLQALEAVGIAAQADRRPNHMSGGQRQRVAIARALARQPSVVLADEPTAALDQATGLAVVNLMKDLNRNHGVTFVFSSHDPNILRTADRVVQLVDGRITP